MSGELVHLADRRDPGRGGAFVCEICGGEFYAVPRLDAFPSCLGCRWFCRHDERRRQAAEREELKA